MATDSSPPGIGPWWKRVGWLLLIWLLSVGALALVAAILKIVMRVAGLSE
jgi:hypothetical protein